jgi:NAD(P)-dependent dehydrogenase (short-subunit alcohol dehydrogenase family)
MIRGGVVVTGASTGIGRETVRRLHATGFDVFGSVRRTDDAAALRSEGVTPLMLDVTDVATIATARRDVLASLAERPLVGLVNNAGIPAAGPIELLALDQLRRVLEVNVVGAVAVTQAFLPELRRSQGRIVNISSVSGRIAVPFIGAYAASKFALEAISDSLRRELLPSGVKVIVLEPGSVRTPIWEKAIAGGSLSSYRGTPYEALAPLVRDQALAGVERGLDPAVVAEAVLEALTTPAPRTRIAVVKRKLRFRLLQLAPDRLIDRASQRALWRR